MKAVIRLILVCICFISSLAQASYITTGTLHQTAVGTTIDYWYFYLESDDVVTVNLRSFNNSGWFWRSTVALDSVFNLYSYDGNLNASDRIATNDDSSRSRNNDAYSDGSTISQDSYLSTYLTAGAYVLLVSDYNINEYLTDFDILTGINIGDNLPNFQTYANYALTWSDNVGFSGDDAGDNSDDTGHTDVPEPPTLSLFLIGLLGLYQVRNKLKWRA